MILDLFIHTLNNRTIQSIPFKDSSPVYLVFPQVIFLFKIAIFVVQKKNPIWKSNYIKIISGGVRENIFPSESHITFFLEHQDFPDWVV